MSKMICKFSKQTLDGLLETIVDEYFQDDNASGLWEVIDYVKGLYTDEIDTLDEETEIIWEK